MFIACILVIGDHFAWVKGYGGARELMGQEKKEFRNIWGRKIDKAFFSVLRALDSFHLFLPPSHCLVIPWFSFAPKGISHFS